jgi:hypothetical protein
MKLREQAKARGQALALNGKLLGAYLTSTRDQQLLLQQLKAADERIVVEVVTGDADAAQQGAAADYEADETTSTVDGDYSEWPADPGYGDGPDMAESAYLLPPGESAAYSDAAGTTGGDGTGPVAQQLEGTNGRTTSAGTRTGNGTHKAKVGANSGKAAPVRAADTDDDLPEYEDF